MILLPHSAQRVLSIFDKASCFVSDFTSSFTFTSTSNSPHRAQEPKTFLFQTNIHTSGLLLFKNLKSNSNPSQYQNPITTPIPLILQHLPLSSSKTPILKAPILLSNTTTCTSKFSLETPGVHKTEIESILKEDNHYFCAFSPA